MKLSFKKAILIILPILVLGGGVYYYFNNIKDNSEDQNKGNWIYRKSLNIENDRNTSLAEEEILLTVDTKELIDARKLQTNCADLRFVDDDNFSQLNYWIEGGCNTQETQVWVKIPLIPVTGKTIYMYYGNEFADDTQESWNGEFIIENTSGCNNMKEAESFSGKYVMGSKEYGNLGGESEHTHTIEASNNKCNTKVYLSSKSKEISDSNIISKTISYTENSLPSTELYFCSSTNGLMEENSLAILDTKSIPSEWSLFEDLEGKFSKGTSKNKTTSQSSAHTHKAVYSENTTEGDDNILLAKTLEIKSSSDLPPYYTVKYVTNNEKSFFSQGSISMFTKLPPLGWTYYSELEDRFPLGNSKDIGETGGSLNHKHTIVLQTKKATGTLLSEEYICIDNNISTSESSSLPEYVSVVFAKKKSSLKVSVNTESAIFEKEQEKTLTEEKKSEKGEVIAENTNTKENGDVLGVAAPEQPTDLLVDGRTNPTYILSSSPTFSAMYSDTDGDSATAYEIEVNSNSTFTGSVKWDSGKVTTTVNNGARSAEYSYNGTALTNSQSTFYWRIRFWDTDDDVSEWSDTASFVDLYNHSQLNGIRLKGIKIN